MGLNSFVIFVSLAFSSPIAAAILPNGECGCTKTVFQTVTETATKVLCETSSRSITTTSTSPPSTWTSTTSEITTIFATSTVTETFTLNQSTLTATIEPFTSQQSQSASSGAPVPTSLPSGISESQEPVHSSTTIPPTITITTTTTISPTPPYANSTTSMPTSQRNGTAVSRGGGSLSTITRTGAFYSSYSFSRTIPGTGLSSMSTFQTSISCHMHNPYLSHSSFSITTHSSSTAVLATSGQTTSSLTTSANTTTSLAPMSLGVSTSRIPYTSNPLPSSTVVELNPAVNSTTSRSSAAYSSSSMTTTSTPSSESRTPAVYATTLATKEPSEPEHSGYGYKINKRHRGGGENSEEGEGYWGNAKRI